MQDALLDSRQVALNLHVSRSYATSSCAAVTSPPSAWAASSASSTGTDLDRYVAESPSGRHASSPVKALPDDLRLRIGMSRTHLRGYAHPPDSPDFSSRRHPQTGLATTQDYGTPLCYFVSFVVIEFRPAVSQPA